MSLRKPKYEVRQSKSVLFLSSEDFYIIIKNFDNKINTRASKRMHADLAIAFANFRSDHRDQELQIRPHQIKEDLRQIQSMARRLAELLDTKPEAAGAMACAMRPEVYRRPSLMMAPPAPVYQASAAEIEDAARTALKSPLPELPYVNDNRGDGALGNLVTRLIEIWQTYAKEAPTFTADSPFIRFTRACCQVLGLRVVMSAMPKRAARIYAALPRSKKNRAKTRRPRGPARATTGQIVRKRRPPKVQ